MKSAVTNPSADFESEEPRSFDRSRNIDYGDAIKTVSREWKFIGAFALTAAVLGAALSYTIKPTFTARTSFLSPQQQGGASAALAQLGALAGLTGAGPKTPADQYASLLQSQTVGNRVIDRFELMSIYESEFREDALKVLTQNVRIGVGKKDNLITIEVDDHDPKRAADMANAYVDELRELSNGLALTEAQQRRAFFEEQMKGVHSRVVEAQASLQRTGFNPGALKSDPRSTGEAYARLKAQITTAEVKIQAARSLLADSAPEIRTQQSALKQLKGQLASMESPLPNSSENQDYVSAYRDFKYQEALFEIMSRQYELAKLDEAKDGTMIQTVDSASPPERRSKPRRTLITIQSTFLGVLGGVAWVLLRRNRATRSLAAP
jgi:uncharacterized protein involved in exopolysaccharide biosynthesis